MSFQFIIFQDMVEGFKVYSDLETIPSVVFGEKKTKQLLLLEL